MTAALVIVTATLLGLAFACGLGLVVMAAWEVVRDLRGK